MTQEPVTRRHRLARQLAVQPERIGCGDLRGHRKHFWMNGGN
jgi:hypothetical protein